MERKGVRMNKEIKSIQGSQRPNPIGPECIRVNKVYDWVVVSNRDKNKVPIPADVFDAIEACRHNGDLVTATCTEVPNSRRCDVLSAVPANIGITSAKIVTLAQHVHIRITFFCNGTQIGQFDVPVSFMEDVILCFPDGTTINCTIFDVKCTVVLNEMLGNMVILDVVVCKDVQVEAEVKLEVEAKFCGPRQAIPIEEIAPQCERFPLFPEQCPEFFPAENCLCQGSASLFNQSRSILVTSGRGLTSVTGNLTLNTTICDNCTLSASDLTVQFLDIPGGDTNVDQSFTFVATQFNQPTCTTIPDTLTVTGVGTFTLAGQQAVDASFTLILNATVDTVTLIIREQTGVDTLVLASDIPVANTTVGECHRF
jgi:hypothetical protein